MLPLPLNDGCLFVDNSMLELLTTCSRALQYNRLELRVAAAEKPSANFGSAIHKALEYRYKNYCNKRADEELLSQQAKLLTQFFTDRPQPIEDFRTLNWAIEVVRRYNNRYNIEPFNLLVNDKQEVMTEVSFALPFYEHIGFEKKIPVIYCGRIDLPVLWDNQLFIVDHKTTSILGPGFFDRMRMSAQQKGYSWAFQELTGRKAVGYVINAIRVKEPPQYVVDGKPRSSKTTTVEQWWDESLQRERFFLQDSELYEWRSNTIELIERFLWHHARGYMPMETAWCTVFGRCPYYDVCTLPAADRGVMLSSGLFTQNTWTPLKQPTQVKQ